MILIIRWKYVFLILLLALAGVGVYYFTHKKEALKLVLPEITEITLIKVDIRQDTAFVDVFVVAENNSPYKLTIDSLEYKLGVGGTEIIAGKQYIGLRQERDQRDTLKLSLKIPTRHTMETIKSLQSQEYTGLQLEASVVYNTIFGIRRLSISKDKKIEVPVPPQFKVVTVTNDVKLLKREADVDLFLYIVNEGKNIDVELTDLQYELNVGKDLKSEKGKLQKKIVIKPESTQKVKFPIDFELNQPLRTAIKVWRDDDRETFHIKLSGYLNAGKLKRVPFVLFATGQTEIVNDEKKEALKEREKAEKKEEREEKRSK